MADSSSAAASSVPALASQLSPADKYELLTRDIAEVLGGDKIKKILEEGERPVRAYWGTAPTGRPHIGYFVPFTKLADFLKAGTEVKVLLAGESQLSRRGCHSLHEAVLRKLMTPLTLLQTSTPSWTTSRRPSRWCGIGSSTTASSS